MIQGNVLISLACINNPHDIFALPEFGVDERLGGTTVAAPGPAVSDGGIDDYKRGCGCVCEGISDRSWRRGGNLKGHINSCCRDRWEKGKQGGKNENGLALKSGVDVDIEA